MVVIEVDVASNDISGMYQRVETLLAVDTFDLDLSVDGLCDGIVSRFVVLRHRNCASVCLQHLNIGIAAVLYTAVRVVNQALEGVDTTHATA